MNHGEFSIVNSYFTRGYIMFVCHCFGAMTSWVRALQDSVSALIVVLVYLCSVTSVKFFVKDAINHGFALSSVHHRFSYGIRLHHDLGVGCLGVKSGRGRFEISGMVLRTICRGKLLAVWNSGWLSRPANFMKLLLCRSNSQVWPITLAPKIPTPLQLQNQPNLSHKIVVHL